MFKEIESELLSILSTNPIDKIAHMPNKYIAKTMDLIYDIKYENIEKVYTESIGKLNRLVVVYNDGTDNDQVSQDLCPINGKIHHITMIPSKVLDTTENNAITLAKSIIQYISIRVALLNDEYKIIDKIKDSTLELVTFQAIPVITCAILRQIYNGVTLPQLIYMTLIDTINEYKTFISKDGINSILNLFDEGLNVEDLIDNGFICAIGVDDPKYPGIWKNEE